MEPAPPATCPRCREVPLGDQPLVRHCSRCKGSWISEAALHARVAAARGERASGGLAWRKEGRAALMCAVCGEPMETLVVHDTAVDRCPRHGVWFDARELAHVLAAVAAVGAPAVAAAAAASSSTGQAGGSTTADLVEAGVEIAAEVGAQAVAESGVFEVVVGGVGYVAEAVVEVIAGLLSSVLD